MRLKYLKCNVSLPGEPTAIWHFLSLILSWFKGVPPMKTWHSKPSILIPIVVITACICTAISRVGAKTRIWNKYNSITWQWKNQLKLKLFFSDQLINIIKCLEGKLKAKYLPYHIKLDLYWFHGFIHVAFLATQKWFSIVFFRMFLLLINLANSSKILVKHHLGFWDYPRTTFPKHNLEY